jgi:hypothetical protein
MRKGTIRNHLGITVSAIRLGTYVQEFNNESLLTSVPDESPISEDRPFFTWFLALNALSKRLSRAFRDVHEVPAMGINTIAARSIVAIS